METAARKDIEFSSFGKRLTRSYVVLALGLIVLVTGTSTILTFSLYARTVDDSIGTAVQQAVSEASYFQEHNVRLQVAAKRIVGDLGHSGFLISIAGSPNGTSLANNWGDRQIERERFGGQILEVSTVLFGLHPGFAHVPGGTIEIFPDFERLGTLFILYWAFVLPVGAIALVAAWLIAQRITRRAIDPLVEVTHSLHRIAGGDFQPEPLLRNSGEMGALIAAYNDVAYRLTAASNEREQNALQMRRFIADAGHELRTPLTIVMGYLDVLLGGIVRDTAAVARIHETMLDESRRMKTLVDRLIFLARLERPEVVHTTRINIAKLLADIVRSLDPIAGNRIHMESKSDPARDIGDRAYEVTADESEISQAFENVIQNALKYAPESDVTVAMNGVRNNLVEVVVADRGSGMSEQDVAHAFDRFYRGTLRGNAEGSGLGLAIAKRAVERAGGTIVIQSVLGSGTTVSVRLPAGALPVTSAESTQAALAQ